VEVDFGDTPEQIKAGKEYSEMLTDKKSFAAILNYMAENSLSLLKRVTMSLPIPHIPGITIVS
jgi:hypothetical protein